MANLATLFLQKHTILPIRRRRLFFEMIFPLSKKYVESYIYKGDDTRKVKFLRSEETLYANDEVLFVRTSI